MNKYTFRRFIASVITIPVALVGYGIIWGLLLALGAGDNGAFYGNLPLIGIVWVLAWTFGPDLERYFEKKGF